MTATETAGSSRPKGNSARRSSLDVAGRKPEAPMMVMPSSTAETRCPTAIRDPRTKEHQPDDIEYRPECGAAAARGGSGCIHRPDLSSHGHRGA